MGQWLITFSGTEESARLLVRIQSPGHGSRNSDSVHVGRVSDNSDAGCLGSETPQSTVGCLPRWKGPRGGKGVEKGSLRYMTAA